MSKNFKALVINQEGESFTRAVKEIDKVLDIILSLKENGIPAVFISHRLDDIFQVCDRICILRRGKIVKICVLFVKHNSPHFHQIFLLFGRKAKMFYCFFRKKRQWVSISFSAAGRFEERWAYAGS